MLKHKLSIMKSHCCPKDNKAVLFSVFLLEAEHLCERESWADISIQNKESLWTAGDNLISEVIDAPPSAQGCILLQIPAVQGREEQHSCSHSAVVVQPQQEKYHLYIKSSIIYKVCLSIMHSAKKCFEVTAQRIFLQLVSILYWMMCNY